METRKFYTAFVTNVSNDDRRPLMSEIRSNFYLRDLMEEVEKSLISKLMLVRREMRMEVIEVPEKDLACYLLSDKHKTYQVTVKISEVTIPEFQGSRLRKRVLDEDLLEE